MGGVSQITQQALRLVLLMVLILAVHSIFLLEQPRGSEQTLPYHKRFAWFTNTVCYVSWLTLGTLRADL